MLSGTARLGTAAGKIRGGSLRGESLRFVLDAEVAGRSVRYEFEGRVEGDAISGQVRSSDGATRDWRARRVEGAAINIAPKPADL